MKKLFMTAVAAFALTTFAENDDYQVLYWQVTGDSLESFVDSAAIAQLCATIGEGGEVAFSEYREINTTEAPIWRTSDWGMDVAGASFYVELLNESGDSLAQSASFTYSALLDGGFFDVNHPGSIAPVNHTGAAVFSGYTAVPEPTSGLLMLLGVAGLALRRRRA